MGLTGNGKIIQELGEVFKEQLERDKVIWGSYWINYWQKIKRVCL